MIGPVHDYHIGHCPLSEVYLIYIILLELALLLSSGDWFSLY